MKHMKGSVHFLEELKAKIALGSQKIVWKELESLHDLNFFFI